MEDLDDYGAMSASLIEVYKLDKKEIYKNYIDKAAEYIITKQHRFTDGSLIRSFSRQYTLWTDDLYMSISFLSRMGELSGEQKYFDDAAKQVINFNKYLFDEDKGLMYHNWYSDIKKQGIAFWGRANGWVLLAQMDLLDRLPKTNSYRDTILSLFKRHIDGVIKYQSSSGLWHQLLDKNDSYPETSCSAMFTYVIARAVNKGLLDESYASYAIQGWHGVKSNIRSDGQIEGVCTGTSVSDDLNYYYNRPAPLNDVHGLGTVLLAGAEVIHLK
jgi:rhamnogalacturonyl hydrolase YesR